MRILIVSEDVPYPAMGGLAKHALTLARTLVALGYTVDFLGGNQHPIEVLGDEGNFGGQFFGELSGHLSGWKEQRLGIYMPFKRTWLAKRFAKIIRRYGVAYDVVHYHGHVPNVGLYIPSDINFVQTRHDQGSDCLKNIRFRNGSICNSIDAKDCASCICPNPNFIQKYISAYSVRQYRNEVAESFRRHPTVFVSQCLINNFSRSMGNERWGQTVHNFVDSELITLASNGCIKKGSHVKLQVIVVAKLYPIKGVRQFIECYVKQMKPGFTLTIVGDGPELDFLTGKFGTDSIQFLGWQNANQTLRLTARADAVVVPSLCEEACATTVLEGLALGKPTFALKAGGTPELVVYQKYDNQLRLHDDLESLTKDLFNLQRASEPTNTNNPMRSASAIEAVELLMPLYQHNKLDEKIDR